MVGVEPYIPHVIITLLCRVAVEREDYDMAKALKQDIDKLRAAGEAAATGQIAEVPKSRRATDPDEIFNRVLGRSVSFCLDTTTWRA